MAGRRAALRMASPMLVFSCFCLLVGDMLFGYDTGSYAGTLTMPGFIGTFGDYNEATHSYAFPKLHISLMSSLAFIGKLLGCLVAAPIIERWGHRVSFYIVCAVSCIGIIIEITASGTALGSGRIAQYIIGRIIVYVGVGLVEVTVTTYQAEIVPAPVRGFVILSLQLFLSVGGIIAITLTRHFATNDMVAFFAMIIPDSPRWLLSKDRNEDAVRSLERLRSKDYAAAGSCNEEITAIREALQEEIHKSRWIDLFRGTNLRRTMLVIVFYFFQQCTGQAFASTYATTFYIDYGYAANAYNYSLINACLSLVIIPIAMFAVDQFGRRKTLLASFFLQAFWMFMLSGIGNLKNKTQAQNSLIVASFMLYSLSYNAGGAMVPYLLGSEIPNAALREKTQALGTTWNVVWAFVSNFTIPYMITAMKFNVGWLFGSISVLALFFAFFFLPETKDRVLEEIDAIFTVPFNPFKPSRVPYTDAELRIGRLEGEKRPDDAKMANDAVVMHAE
ncbi:hypothetical protein SEUCBS139899_001687 [Sporothrix eucalyptigena]